MLSSTYGGKHAVPSPNRSVALETRFSDGGVHVDRRWLSIHAYGALEPLSQAAGKAHLSHTLSIGMNSLAPRPWHGAVEWRWRREVGSIRWRGALCGRISGRAVAPVAVCMLSDDLACVCELCESAAGTMAGAVDSMHGAGPCRP